MTATIGEIILTASKQPTEEQKIEVFQRHLRKYGSDPALQDALRILFDPKLKFNLPAGEPPSQNPNLPDGLGDTNLRIEMRKMYRFIKGNPFSDKMPNQKKEILFIQLLEGLAKSDREVLIKMKDQNIEGLTPELVNKVFPNLIPLSAPIENVEKITIEDEENNSEIKKSRSSSARNKKNKKQSK
jgi:hypothetical protein